MNTLRLSPGDNRAIGHLLSELGSRYTSPCQDEFLRRVHTYALQLPPDVLWQLNDFKHSDDHNGLFLLSGFYIDDQALEPTPAVTGRGIDEFSAAREGFFLMLLISLLGDAFGWSSQRSGALINNVLPLPLHEKEQLSTGSAVDLDWHTEEAFHPYRADYLALMCLRNPDSVPTVIGSIQDITLPLEVQKTLFQPRYHFLADKNFADGYVDVNAATSVLFGDTCSPFVKIDPSFMKAADGDEEAAAALETIIAAFNTCLFDVVLQQGEVLFIDNYRVVHGRRAFTPRFDGADRWLKRVNVTSDLRKSRALRESHHSRVIITN